MYENITKNESVLTECIFTTFFSSPIAQRQETFESAILQRLASLEEKLTEKSTSSKPNNTSLERPRTPPLQQKDSSKSRPCGRVKPLFSKNQPVFAKTPLKERTNIPVTKSAKSCSQARKLIGKDIKIGNKDVILLGTPSPLNDAEPGKVNSLSYNVVNTAGRYSTCGRIVTSGELFLL